MENLNSREGRVFDFHSIPSINPGSTLCLADSWTQVLSKTKVDNPKVSDQLIGRRLFVVLALTPNLGPK